MKPLHDKQAHRLSLEPVDDGSDNLPDLLQIIIEPLECSQCAVGAFELTKAQARRLANALIRWQYKKR